MKFIVISLLAFVVTFGIAGVITWLFARKNSAKVSIKKRILIFCVVGIALFFGGALVFFGIYYHADSRALSYLNSSDAVSVSKTENGYFFDGPGKTDAFIFYPGAKVEETAYAPLLHQLAKKGVDCFLVKMPLRMAMFGRGAAGDIIDKHSYGSWYLGGHSLGGAMAAIYAAEYKNRFDGLILMAAYPTQKLNDGIKLLSLAGDQDQVLKWETYEDNKVNWPGNAEEYIIKGGNHAQFGDYGEQRGDGEPQISGEEQQEQTAEEILELIQGEEEKE